MSIFSEVTRSFETLENIYQTKRHHIPENTIHLARMFELDPLDRDYEDFYVGFEVLTAVVMKSTTFWDIMPCRPLSVN
jgi:hypothetical protein